MQLSVCLPGSGHGEAFSPTVLSALTSLAVGGRPLRARRSGADTGREETEGLKIQRDWADVVQGKFMHTGVTSACFLLSLFTPGHAPQGQEPHQENQQEVRDLELVGWAGGGQHRLPDLVTLGGERPGLGSDPTVLKQFKGSKASPYLLLFLPKLELIFGLFDKNNCHYSILVFLCPQLFIPVNSFWPSPVS